MIDAEYRRMGRWVVAVSACLLLAVLGAALGFVVPYFDLEEAPYDRASGCYTSPEISAFRDRLGPSFIAIVGVVTLLFIVGLALRREEPGSYGAGLTAVFGGAFVLGGTFVGYEIGQLPWDCVALPTPGPIVTVLITAACSLLIVGTTRGIPADRGFVEV